MNGSSGARSSSTTPPGPVKASACTITFPVISSPAPPAPQRRYSEISRSSGSCALPAMPSSMAAFAIRFRSFAPDGSTNGENNSVDIDSTRSSFAYNVYAAHISRAE